MNKDQLFELVISQVLEVLPSLEAHIFERDDQLVELGANSMDRSEIVMMIMEALSLQIPRVELFGPTNLGELVDLLHEKI